MPNHIAAEYDKMTITRLLIKMSMKLDEMTVAYELKLDDEDKYSDQKIFTKVLKLDETVKMDMQ